MEVKKPAALLGNFLAKILLSHYFRFIFEFVINWLPVPVAAWSKALVYDRSPAEIVGSNLAGGMDVCLLWVLCVDR